MTVFVIAEGMVVAAVVLEVVIGEPALVIVIIPGKDGTAGGCSDRVVVDVVVVQWDTMCTGWCFGGGLAINGAVSFCDCSISIVTAIVVAHP